MSRRNNPLRHCDGLKTGYIFIGKIVCVKIVNNYTFSFKFSLLGT